jgi:hypothetical protein
MILKEIIPPGPREDETGFQNKKFYLELNYILCGLSLTGKIE